MKYEFLFPYEDVPYNSKVLIYGAGDVGQEYLKQLFITKYAIVIGFVDKNYDKYNKFVVPVYSPNDIGKLDFDFVILAFKRGDYVEEITDSLSKMGVRRKQIIYRGTRNIGVEIVIRQEKGDTTDKIYAYNKSPLSIALKYGPGLGDAIIKKALFIELTKMLPGVLIDIYAPGGSKFIPSLYSDQEMFNCVVDDGGGLYIANKNKYTISMSIFRLIEVDYINFSILEESNHIFAEAMRKHIKMHNEYKLSNFPSTQIWIHYGRAKFKNWDCYSLYQYTGVFYTTRNKMKILLDDTKKNALNDYKSYRYITVNYGNGAAGKGHKEYTNKQWPLAYFNEFVVLFKQRYCGIKVVQLGDGATDKIDNIDKYFLGRNLEEVKWILKGAVLHVDIEGGLVHLATHIGTKCAVLFGPTQVDMYAYPENINIVSTSCRGCYGLYEHTYKCARDLKKPECMMAITPKVVMKNIEEYMESKKIDFD